MANYEDGPITQFPADDLPKSQRFITSHDANGNGVFVCSDNGDHHKIMVKGNAVANIIYSTTENPVNLAGEVDIAQAKAKEPGLHIHNGSVVRLIDFAPGVESPMHRALSIDYGVVVEGEFELTLDSGESRIMRRGDVSVNRACMHKWKNCSTTQSGRMLFILLDCKPFSVAGKSIVEDLGDLAGEYNEE